MATATARAPAWCTTPASISTTTTSRSAPPTGRCWPSASCRTRRTAPDDNLLTTGTPVGPPVRKGRASAAPKEKRPIHLGSGVFGCNSLTMTYFHTGTRTIIGAEAFHCPVRDGKEWDHFARVIRYNGLPFRRNQNSPSNRRIHRVRISFLIAPGHNHLDH